MLTAWLTHQRLRIVPRVQKYVEYDALYCVLIATLPAGLTKDVATQY